jgi:hypothetical protein
MSVLVSTEDALRLARKTQERYLKSGTDRTFGDWVMVTIFPDLEVDFLKFRDFCGAQRTEDGRIYLVGKLLSGSLPDAQLRKYLGEEPALQATAHAVRLRREREDYCY